MKPALLSAVPTWRPLLQKLLAVTPAGMTAVFRGLTNGAVAFERGERGGARLMLKHARELRKIHTARAAAERLIEEIERVAPAPARENER